MHYLLKTLKSNRHFLAVPEERPTRPVSKWTGFTGLAKIVKTKIKCEVVRGSRPNPRGERPKHLYGSAGTPIAKDDRGRLMALALKLNAETRDGRKQGALKGSGLAVLQALLFIWWDHFTGLCDPAAQTIAAAAGVSVRTVWRALARLRASGLLTRIRRCKIEGGRAVQTSNRYEIGSSECQTGLGTIGMNLNLVESGIATLRGKVKSCVAALGFSDYFVQSYRLW